MWRALVEVLLFVWITCLGFALFYSSAQAATRTDIDHAIVQLGKTVPNMKLEVELTKTWSRAYVSDRIEGALLTMDHGWCVLCWRVCEVVRARWCVCVQGTTVRWG